MNLNPVVLAIPMYFILMGLELGFEAITRRKTYRFNDAITNINTGVLSQLTGTFFKLFKVGIYVVIFEQFAFFHLADNWISFIVLFILFDLCYYWEHRMAHSVNLFWGGHSVHHQSEDYNLSVALRQSSTAFIWGFPFYLPLALMGFDPVQFVIIGGLNLLYQFWIHTEHINKLPKWFEAVLNTPSHHRVHHGRDPKYIDKNYAGVFIIWDRLFGTFKQEEERPHYGITTPLKSWNPVYANFAHYIDLFATVKQARNVGDGVKILFNKPGWQPDYMGGYIAPQKVAVGYRKYDTLNTTFINLYVFFQFVGALLVGSYFLFNVDAFSIAGKTLMVSWVIGTTIMFGYLFETNKWWLSLLEVVRLLCLPMLLFFLVKDGMELPFWSVGLGAVFGGLSLLIFLTLDKRQKVEMLAK